MRILSLIKPKNSSEIPSKKKAAMSLAPVSRQSDNKIRHFISFAKNPISLHTVGTKYLAYITFTSTVPLDYDPAILDDKLAGFFRNYYMCTRYENGDVVKIRWHRIDKFTYACNTVYTDPYVTINFRLALKDAVEKTMPRHIECVANVVTKVIGTGVVGNVLA